VVKSYLKEKLDILQNLTQKCTVMMMMMILFGYWFESFCLFRHFSNSMMETGMRE
jgi:hypothetical protein